MDEEDKLPLKRVEFSLTKFNEVAIPHHLDLLRQHKANIIKYEELGEYVRARAEQTNARRVAAQLRALLLELEALRHRVREQDRARFDSLTQRSRDTTLRAIVDYLGTTPLSINRSSPEAAPLAASAVSTDSVGVVAHADGGAHADDGDDFTPPVFQSDVQLHVDDHVRLAPSSAGGRSSRRPLTATRRLCRRWRCTNERRCCAAGASCRPRCARCTTCGSTRRPRRWRSASTWRPWATAWPWPPTTWAPRAATWPPPRGCGRARGVRAARPWACWWAARWGWPWAPRPARWPLPPARWRATQPRGCCAAACPSWPRPPTPRRPRTRPRPRPRPRSPAARRSPTSATPACAVERAPGQVVSHHECT